jgi:tetratricopeptide (TPR) repeat protein
MKGERPRRDFWSDLRAGPGGLLPATVAFAGLYSLLLVVYFPALGGSFLWNDPDYVTKPALQGLGGLGRIWGEPGATEQYYPLLHTVFWLEHRLWADHALGYHLATLALHAASVVTLAAALRWLATDQGDSARLFPARAVWPAALLFALHPVCVESVAWISEQKNTLSLFFYLLAGLFFLRSSVAREKSADGWALGFYLASILSKSLTATLPAALAVVLWWRSGRLDWRRHLRPLVPWCLLGTAVGLFTAWDERHFGGAQGVHFTLSAIGRVIVASRVVWFYLGKAVWPHPLAFFYEHWSIDPRSAAQYVALGAFVCATALLARVGRRERAPLALWLLFVGSLFPVLGFLNVYAFVFSYVADHWQYLPLMFAMIALALAWEGAASRWKGAQRGLRCALGLVLVLFAGLTWRAAGSYRDVEVLYRSTLAVNPDAWLAHTNLGTLLLERGDARDALAELQAAERLVPWYPEIHTNLGDALGSTGRYPEAIEQYRQAIALEPRYTMAHVNRARALVITGQPREAIEEYQAALALQPAHADWELGLAIAYGQAGQPARSLEHDQAALRLSPDFPEAYNNEATALVALGRVPEALEALATAIKLRPDYADARSNLATLWAAMGDQAANHGDFATAIGDYRTALSWMPRSDTCRASLGLALAMSGQTAPALEQLDLVLQAKPDFAQAHAYRGYALALAHRYREAVAEYDLALKVKPGDADVLYQRDVAARAVR